MKRICLVFFFAVLLVLPAQANAVGPAVVVFDQGHGQAFLVERQGELDLSGLAELMGEAGAEVRINRGPIDQDALAGARALVVSGPFRPFSTDEIETVAGFLEEGGRLAVMLHIGPPAASLLGRLGVSVSNGVIRESEELIEGDPLNFRVRDKPLHPLFEGLDGFALYGAWALLGEGDQVTTLAVTGPWAWIDLDGDRRLGAGDAAQRFAVAVAGPFGAGRFVVFGDDALFQNRFLIGDNRRLGANLARWLVQTSPP